MRLRAVNVVGITLFATPGLAPSVRAEVRSLTLGIAVNCPSGLSE